MIKRMNRENVLNINKLQTFELLHIRSFSYKTKRRNQNILFKTIYLIPRMFAII